MSLLQGFASVNEERQTVDLQTQEAKELRVINSWEQALALVAAQRNEEAEYALRQLLAEPVVADPATDQLHRIKFLALKSLADLLARRPEGVPDALAVYCLATEVVGDDAVLWNRLGTLAAEAGYWAAARSAFERGLELDPSHPTMADKLLQLLLHVADGQAAGALAAAMLRRNPRHAAAAAVAANTAADRPPAALCGGLLQLAPLAAAAPGGGLPIASSALQPLATGWGWHHAAPERPRTLDQPTWHQLLHHSLLFLGSNRMVPEGGGGAPGTYIGGTSATASPSADHAHKGVAPLVRFNIKRAQPLPQQGGHLSGAAAATPVCTGAPQAQPPATDGPAAAAAEAPAVPVDAAVPHEAAGQPATPAAPTAAATGGDSAAAATAAAAAQQAASEPAATPLAQTPAAAEPGSAAVPPPAAERIRAPAAAAVPSTLEADEEQEQRHPNGTSSRASGSSRKLEGRATRSRAATGKAGPPLLPAGASSDAQGSPEEDAVDLLSTLGSLLSAPQQAPRMPAAAASPLLASPCTGLGGGGGEHQLGMDAAAGQKEEEAAVKSFVKRLPQQGVGRQDLAFQLLGTLGTPTAAAKLPAAARQQLLQVAQLVQHSVPELPASHCLVLGELFAYAAAAASAAAQRSAGPAPAAAPAAGGSPQLPRSGVPRRPSMRTRRSELSTATLQQSARLWLSRYRLAAAEGGLPPGAAVDEQQPAGMVRYWWATGRLMESSGDMPAAAAAYATCQEGLPLLGGRAIALPHCQPDASISAAAVHGKQEALQLHTVLDEAEKSVAAGDHAAVVAALAPVLLCCTDKEQQMLQLDGQQWQRGMQMLLAAASAGGSWALALRCHLRLLNALLPNVPPQLLALMREQQEEPGAAASAPLPLLLAAAEQVALQSAAAAALDAAASFLHQHSAALVLCAPPGRSGGSQAAAQQQQQQQEQQQQKQQQQEQQPQQQQLALHALEAAMYEAVQNQLVALVAGCSAALAAAGPAAAQSQLNMKVNAERAAACDAATALLRLCSLAAGSGTATGTSAGLLAVEQAQELAWLLCDALGSAQALMERHGRFVQTCLAELQVQLGRLGALRAQLGTAAAAAAFGGGAAAAADGTEGAPDVDELRAVLTAGLQHCLRWLFGLELPGLDEQEEWGGSFQAKSAGDAAARQLGSRQAVADVWPLVEPHLLEDLQHVARHKGFLLAAAQHFQRPPPSVANRFAATWRYLAVADAPMLPCDELDSASSADPMQTLLQLAAARGGGASARGTEAGAAPAAAEPMAVDGQEWEAAADAAVEAGAMREEEAERYGAVTRSLFYLLSVLQDAEDSGGRSLLGSDAEAALEERLQAVKWDLCYNPGRSESWEKLAVEYHVAADDLLNEASKARTHLEWKYDPVLQGRERTWRRLASWASAGAWLAATDGEERLRLLTATGSRLLEGVLRTLPCQDPLAPGAAWLEAKAEPAHAEGCRLALAAYTAAEALLESGQGPGGEDWEVALRRARCLRKLGQPAANWLPQMARACHYAAHHDEGVLLPLYALHASRMRLLLGLPSVRRWCGGGAARQRHKRNARRLDPSPAQERQLLNLVGDYCFLPASSWGLCSPTQPARSPAADAADAEMEADWRSLLEDCCAAMQWCLEKDRNFHRAAYRLAAAMQQTDEPHKAVAALAPLFSRAKQPFVVMLAPIQESQVGGAGKKRGRPGKAARQAPPAAAAAEPEAEAEGLPMPECRWGEAPALVASVGLQEDEATFGTRLRKMLRLYLSCLADAAVAEAEGREPLAGRPPPLDVLQAAAVQLASPLPSAGKVWEGCGKLARGHFLLALAAGLRACCPLEQLQVPEGPQEPSSVLPPSASDGNVTQPPELPAQHTPGIALRAAAAAGAALGTAPRTGAAPLSACAHATPAEAAAAAAARALWQSLPTPATQGRKQQSARLLQMAARLEGGRGEPLLVKAHQVFADYDLHAEGDDRWRSEAAPSMKLAQSIGVSVLAADAELGQLWKQPDVCRKLFGLYAALYVHLLQRQGEADKLLQLLLAMKKRVKTFGAAEPKQARFLRRQALVLSEALLSTLEAGLDSFELEVGPTAGTTQQQQQQQEGVAAAATQQQQEAAAGGAAVQQAGGAGGAAPMEVEGGAAHKAQQEQQQLGSPAPGVQQVPAAKGGEQPSPAGACPVPHAAAATPTTAAGGGLSRNATPGTDLRAALGTPLAALPSAEQQQLQERGLALLQVAHGFHKDVTRWLQVAGAAAGGSSGSGARDELRAVGRSGEQAVLRAYRLYAGCAQPGAATASLSRAEQLKAAEEAVKQQRRQSRQQGGRQVAVAAAATAGGGGGGGLLPAIAESAEERPAAAAAAGGRKRGAAAAGAAGTAGDALPPRSTRKRGCSRSGTAEPDAQQKQQRAAAGKQEEEEGGVPERQEEDARQVEQVMEEAVAGAVTASADSMEA